MDDKKQKLLAERDAIIAKHEQKLAKTNAKLRAIASKEKKQARRNDTRMKIMAGALAMTHMEKNPKSAFGKKMLSLLEEYVPEKDQHLFECLSDEAK